MAISSPEDLARVKQLRRISDAIMVGVGTVLSDDPHLTVKDSIEQSPIRVVLDSSGRTPDHAKVLDGRVRTIMVTNEECEKSWENAETIRVGKGRVDLDALLDLLGEMGVETLLVEGGGELLWSFFKGGLVDRYSVFVGSKILGGRTAPTPVDGEGFDDKDLLNMELVQCRRLGDGIHLVYEVTDDFE